MSVLLVHHHLVLLGARLDLAHELELGLLPTLRRPVQARRGLPLRSRVDSIVSEVLLLLQVLSVIEGHRHLLRLVELAWLAKVGLSIEALG